MTDERHGDDRGARLPATSPEDPWPDSPYPPLELPAAHRPRVPGWTVVVAAVTAALATAAFVVAFAWPDSGPGEPASTLGFESRELVRQVALGEPTENNTFTQVVGDRAYVAWQQDDALVLRAVDLATGEDLWASEVPGQPDRYWTAVHATSTAVVAVLDFPEPQDPEEEDGPGPAPMVVLSADDGEPRWDREIHAYDEMWLGEETMVLVDRTQRAVRGLSLDSGELRWRIPFRRERETGTTVVPVRTAAHQAAPSGWWGPPVGTYQQVVVVSGDRSARVVDIRDGSVASRAANVAYPEDIMVAYQDRLYVAGNYPGYRVDARDLDDLSRQPRSVYVAPDPHRVPTALARCGASRLCLLDRGSEWDTAQVRAVDLAPDRDDGDPQLWQHDTPHADTLLTAGEWTLVAGGEASLVGYDRDGTQVLDQPEGAAVRLDESRLLLFATTPSSGPQDLSVAGLPVGGDRVELGQLTGVRGDRCAWSQTYLACPDERSARIWRFTSAT